jgi:hypothetical protein
MSEGWGVVQTNWGQERLAHEFIFRLGYDPLLITYRRRMKGWKIDEATGRRKRSRTDGVLRFPLLRGYLFVPLDDLGAEIDRQPGVLRVIRHPSVDGGPGNPKLVRAYVILQIREAADRGDFDEIQAESPILVKVGDRVKSPSGIVGTLIALDEKGRADLATELFGGGVSRGIDARNLERVG